MYNSSVNRQQRIKMLRIKLYIHRRVARHNMITKGPHHYDSIHEWGVVEEISFALSNELDKLKEESEAKIREYHEYIDSWDNDVMEKTYDI